MHIVIQGKLMSDNQLQQCHAIENELISVNVSKAENF